MQVMELSLSCSKKSVGSAVCIFSDIPRPSLTVSKYLMWGSSTCSTSGEGSWSLKFHCSPENHVKVIQKGFHCVVQELLNPLWHCLASSGAVLVITVRRRTHLWNLEGRNHMLSTVFLPLRWGNEEQISGRRTNGCLFKLQHFKTSWPWQRMLPYTVLLTKLKPEAALREADYCFLKTHQNL